MMRWTRLWRTTSFSLNWVQPMPSILPQISRASMRPLFLPEGKSICVTSPVMTALELKPRRVKNIFICSLVVFCASSRMTKESERAAPHESERRDFNNSLFEKSFELVGVEHFVERVVERAHVGIDFFLKRAGEKAELFTGFDGRASQDDAVDLFREKRADCHSNGEIGFAGA